MNEHALKIFPLYAIASFDVFSYPKKKKKVLMSFCLLKKYFKKKKKKFSGSFFKDFIPICTTNYFSLINCASASTRDF